MAKLRNISNDTLDVREFGAVVEPDGVLEVPDAVWADRTWAESLWSPVEVPRTVFDPSEHTVPQVLAHLAKADDAERARVLEAERAGKGRAGILNDGEES